MGKYLYFHSFVDSLKKTKARTDPECLPYISGSCLPCLGEIKNLYICPPIYLFPKQSLKCPSASLPWYHVCPRFTLASAHPPPPPPHSPGELLHILQDLIQCHPLPGSCRESTSLCLLLPLQLLPLPPARIMNILWLWIYTFISLTSSKGMSLIPGFLSSLLMGPELIDVGCVEVRMGGSGCVFLMAPSSAGMRQHRRETQVCSWGESLQSSA